MAELKRKEEDLTTADLAGRGQEQKDVRHDAGPKLVPGSRPGETAGPQTPVAGSDSRVKDMAGQSTPLFSEGDVTELRARWSTVQAAFVDEPRKAVEEADNLVASVMKRLAEGFANERGTLEKQWDRGDSVSTEDLRVALQRYRSFFDRLLKA